MPTSIWQRIQKVHNLDPFKPIDRLYIEYDRDKFAGLVIDSAKEPELFNFVSAVINSISKFDDFPKEQLEYFARRIYELRKDNSNNPA